MCVNPYRSVILAVLTPVASVFAADRVSVFTKQLPGREAAAWEVEVVTRGEVESRVLDSEGDLVAGPFAAKRFAVAGTKAWSAEKPVWYTLVTESDGERKETVFGFAEQVIRGGRLYVNGRPVRVKAGPKALNGNAGLAAQAHRRRDARRERRSDEVPLPRLDRQVDQLRLPDRRREQERIHRRVGGRASMDAPR